MGLRPLTINNQADYQDFLVSLVSFTQPKTIVEIGVFEGYTAAMMCNIVKSYGGKYFGYDIFGNYGAYVVGKTIAYMDQTMVENHFLNSGLTRDNFLIRTIDSHSEGFKDVLTSDTGGVIDFAFIDGDHSYAGVTDDFLKIYPLLSDEGIMVLHDTYSHTGCRKFVLDLYGKYNDGTFDIMNFPYGNGGQRLGLTILMKRSYPKYRAGLFANEHEAHSGLTPNLVYDEEQAWYQNQLRKYN